MNTNNIVTDIEEMMGQTMTKITEAAGNQDLAALEGLTRRASELRQMKEQVSAIQQRLRSMADGGAPQVRVPGPDPRFRREIRIEVSQGMINQNLLTLTEAIKRGTVRVGEELIIEALPSERKFKTVVMASGNKLQERGEINKFYSSAGVREGDYVILQEVSLGQWKLRKAEGLREAY